MQQASDLPVWNFDGSSTNQAEGHDSDVYLYPVALFHDPFRGKPNKMVLCTTNRHDGTPTPTNYRKTCADAMKMDKVKDSETKDNIEKATSENKESKKNVKDK